MYKFFIFIFFVSLGYRIDAQNIKVDIQPHAIYFTEGKDSILVYQIAEKTLNGTYKRSNYIHPLYSLDGQILTEDFPPDHLHHRGIFWAWHQLYIGDKKIGDAWDIKDFFWKIKSVKVLEQIGTAGVIQTEVLWKSPQWKDNDGNEKEVVKETTTIIVYPAENSYRQIDFEISLVALEKNMRLGGAENEKGYGGFSTRIRLVENIEFTSSTGKVIPDRLPVTAGGWMDISGSIGKEGALAGLSILCHPDNPGYPNPWILRSSGSVQNAVYPHPGATAVPLSGTQPTILRYRLLIHEGNSSAMDISKIHSDYGGL
jgi:hypothetical protein